MRFPISIQHSAMREQNPPKPSDDPYAMFALTAGCVYLTYISFEGLFRYFFVSIGLQMGTYFSLPFVVISGGWWILRSIRIYPSVGLPVLMLGLVHLLVGILLSPDIRQPLLGIRMLMLVFSGAAAIPFLLRQTPGMSRFLGIIFILSVVGVAINAVGGRMPWNTVEISVGNLSLTGAGVDYDGDGTYRAAGFSRDHQIVSGIVTGLCLVFLSRWRNRWYSLLLLAVTLWTVYTANAKTNIVTLLLIAPMVVVLRGQARGVALKLLLVLVTLLSFAMPIILTGTHYAMPNMSSNLYSFIDRIDNTWPEAWRAVSQDGMGMLGLGIGGVGTPQRLFGTHDFYIIDSSILYIWGWFGLPGMVYFLVLVLVLLRCRSDDPSRHAYLACSVYGVAYCSTMGFIEDPISSLFFCGPALACAVGDLSEPLSKIGKGSLALIKGKEKRSINIGGVT